MFGVKSSVCLMFLHFGWRVLVHALRSDIEAKVCTPTAAEVETFLRLTTGKYFTFGNVHTVADGLYLGQSRDVIFQKNVSQWLKIRLLRQQRVCVCSQPMHNCMALKTPRARQDYTIAERENLNEKLSKTYEKTGGRCLEDSAFGKRHYLFLIKSALVHPHAAKTHAAGHSLNPSNFYMANIQLRNVRLKRSFPRLKERMLYDERGERIIILLSVVKLSNLCARLVSINQILSSYIPHLGQEANQLLLFER